MNNKLKILFSILILNMGCSMSNIRTHEELIKPIDNSIKESVKPTSSPTVQQTTQPVSVPIIEPSSISIVNNFTSKHIYTDKNLYIDGIKINIDKIIKSNQIIYPKIKLNTKGDGFITFYSNTGKTVDIVDKFYNETPKEKISYALVKNYTVETEVIKDDFDAISIDNNGNGIVYSYNRATYDIDPDYKNGTRYTNFRNEISYRSVKNYVISDEKKIIETLKNYDYSYTPSHLILSPNGNGMFIDFKYKIETNVTNSKKQEVFVKKVTNFVPEKDFIKIGEIDNIDSYDKDVITNKYSNILDYLDSLGNGYIKYQTIDNKTGVLPIKNYSFDFDTKFIVNTEFENYPNKLDENGNGELVYLKFIDPDIKDLIISTIKNYKNVSTRVIKNFQNNRTNKNANIYLTTSYLSNGNGFITWNEYDFDKGTDNYYIQDIKDYKLI